MSGLLYSAYEWASGANVKVTPNPIEMKKLTDFDFEKDVVMVQTNQVPIESMHYTEKQVLDGLKQAEAEGVNHLKTFGAVYQSLETGEQTAKLTAPIKVVADYAGSASK